ncbi:hypothetical protein [Myroides odoratimimus]|uniref:hypothetical protein n=1 Tax=Myroides odoratimimus TaxID=76832 RepID=UPI003100C565
MKQTILYFLILYSFICQAQNITPSKDMVSNITPPLPESASLIGKSNLDSKNSQGKLDFNIPIYSMNYYGFEVPITLSYDSKANKVANRASSVGLGWNLVVGGQISRVVRDSEDESNLGYLTFGEGSSKNFEADKTLRTRIADKFIAGAPEKPDMEPDMYYFDFNGVSGSFIIDNTTFEPVLQTYEDLKVKIFFKSNSKVIDRFVITDARGNQYYFGKDEKGNNSAIEYRGTSYTYMIDNQDRVHDMGNSGNANTILTWKLVKIITENKKEITFDYIINDTQYKSVSSIAYDNVQTEDDFGNIKYSIQEMIYYTDTYGKEMMLSSVNFSDKGAYIFRYDHGRQDLPGAKALSEIIVYGNVSNTPYLVKKLDYSYTNNTSISNMIGHLRNEKDTQKRMFLKEIKSYDTEKKEFISEYQFKYNDAMPMPNIFSKSVDLWGYYNGKKNNSFIENTYNLNREVDPYYSSIGLLTEVINATKGTIKIDYEANKVITPSYFKYLYLRWLKPIRTTSLGNEVYGPANRVKSINYYTDNSLVNTSNFSYELNGISTGRIYSIPAYSMIQRQVGNKVFYLYGKYITGGLIEDYNTGEIGYYMVTEETPNLVKNERYYTSYGNRGHFYVFPFHVPIDLGWTRGKLIKDKSYKYNNNSWTLQREEEFVYNFYKQNSHPFIWTDGYTIKDMVDANYDKEFDFPYLASSGITYSNTVPTYQSSNFKNVVPLYKFLRYYGNTEIDQLSYGRTNPDVYRKSFFVGGTMNVIQKNITEYENGVSRKTIENYNYNSGYHNFLTQKTTQFFGLDKIEENYQYVQDLNSSKADYKQMIQDNVLSNVMKKISKRNGETLFTTENLYKDIGGNIFRLENIIVQKKDGTPEEMFKSIKYFNAEDGKSDCLGAVKEVIDKNNIPTAFQYRYGNVILKMHGSEYKPVTIFAWLDLEAQMYKEFKEKIANWNKKDGVNVEGYIYDKYEINLIEKVNSNNTSQYYDYDKFNRLKLIKDDKGNILQEYEYNYKNN